MVWGWISYIKNLKHTPKFMMIWVVIVRHTIQYTGVAMVQAMVSQWVAFLRGKAAILGMCSLALGACSATYSNHGYVPPAEQLAEINIGVDRVAVAEAIGTPGSAGVVRDEAWFYSAYRIRNYAYRAPQVVERDIVAISFNNGGRVSNIERFGLEDGQVVQLSRRVTTGSVTETTFLRQILQSIGRLNLDDTFGN